MMPFSSICPMKINTTILYALKDGCATPNSKNKQYTLSSSAHESNTRKQRNNHKYVFIVTDSKKEALKIYRDTSTLPGTYAVLWAFSFSFFFGSSLTVQLQGKAPYNKKLHSKPLAHQNCLYCLKINQTHKILQHLLECHSEKPTFLGLFPCSHHHNFCKTGRSHSGHFRNDSFIIAIPQLQFDHKKKQIEQ